MTVRDACRTGESDESTRPLCPPRKRWGKSGTPVLLKEEGQVWKPVLPGRNFLPNAYSNKAPSVSLSTLT